jgi:hypothetical protein
MLRKLPAISFDVPANQNKLRSSDSKAWNSDSEHHDSVSAINSLRRSAGPLTIEGVTNHDDNREDRMARQSQRERNAKQRERQQQLRDQHKAERRPDRDDVARLLLAWSISGHLMEGRPDRVEQLGDILVGKLVDQGFDERASYEVFDALVDRYASGDSPFRRKVHLRA